MAKKQKVSIYEEMVVDLSSFVMKVATKDNPAEQELVAMVEIAKMLFRTI